MRAILDPYQYHTTLLSCSLLSHVLAMNYCNGFHYYHHCIPTDEFGALSHID